MSFDEPIFKALAYLAKGDDDHVYYMIYSKQLIITVKGEYKHEGLPQTFEDTVVIAKPADKDNWCNKRLNNFKCNFIEYCQEYIDNFNDEYQCINEITDPNEEVKFSHGDLVIRWLEYLISPSTW